MLMAGYRYIMDTCRWPQWHTMHTRAYVCTMVAYGVLCMVAWLSLALAGVATRGWEMDGRCDCNALFNSCNSSSHPESPW